MSTHGYHFEYAADVKDMEAEGNCLSLSVKKRPIVLFSYNSKVYALDNRCPHMGFPLSQGTIKNGILTCHWHHARFDLHNGGTFDQWAGDVESYPVQIRNNGEIWIGMPFEGESSVGKAAAGFSATASHTEMMLDNGLKRNISLIIAKAIIGLSSASSYQNSSKSSSLVTDGYSSNDNDVVHDSLETSFRKGLEFGTEYKQSGWGVGLTIHACMMNIAALFLNKSDKLHALYHGLSAVAQDCASMPPRFPVPPLPEPWPDLSTLKSWFRQFIESRNATAAERCLVTAIHADADAAQLADMLFAAATDHRFIGGGHTLDFTNKALEALDCVGGGWKDKKLVESVLSSLVSGYANAERMEESSSWRHPIDLVAMLDDAFKELPGALEEGRLRREARPDDTNEGSANKEETDFIDTLLGDDPKLIINDLLDALRQGISEEELAGKIAYTAALRIAQFNTRNEFTDWDAALHTFTFANAVHQCMRRISGSVRKGESKSQFPANYQRHELTRAVFDGAMRVYLNRFLNIPPASIPDSDRNFQRVSISNVSNVRQEQDAMTEEKLSTLLDKQQQVNAAGQLVADFFWSRTFTGNNNSSNDNHEFQLEQERRYFLMDLIGRLLIREDRSFHLIQMIEAALKQCSTINSTLSFSADHPQIVKEYHFMLAAVRYLAAHSPSMRSQTHTYQTAVQLSLGQNLFE
jgi:nitrite reductase/ring-hydroxylating ferredoxin subunit